MPDWSVPGYELLRRLGLPGVGEVWLARDRGTLETVTVRLWAGNAPAELDQLGQEAALLGEVRHPHLVRLRTVLPVEGGIALVSDFVAGRSLADLLATRDPLTTAEVLTIGVPLAAALAAVHARSLVHGRVAATNVLLTAEGFPLLADLGVHPLSSAEAPVVPAEDVRALAEVLREALGGHVPRGLDAITRALSCEPGQPTAGQLASELRAAGHPVPLRLAGPAGEQPAAAPVGDRSDQSVRRLPARRVPRASSRPSPALLAGVPLALLVAVLAGRAWAAADRPAGPPTLQAPHAGRATPEATDWASVLTALDARRAAALATLDVRALDEVYAEGSAPIGVDSDAIRRMAAAGVRPDGLRLDIRSVQPVRRTADLVTLRVVDRLPPYDLVGADGRVRERRPGRGPASWLVSLVPGGSGWRIQAVSRA